MIQGDSDKDVEACRYLPVIAWDDDVHPSAGLTDVGVPLIIHFPRRIRKRSRGIDNTFGSDIKFLPYERKTASITRGYSSVAGDKPDY